MLIYIYVEIENAPTFTKNECYATDSKCCRWSELALTLNAAHEHKPVERSCGNKREWWLNSVVYQPGGNGRIYFNSKMNRPSLAFFARSINFFADGDFDLLEFRA